MKDADLLFMESNGDEIGERGERVGGDGDAGIGSGVGRVFRD